MCFIDKLLLQVTLGQDQSLKTSPSTSIFIMFTIQNVNNSNYIIKMLAFSIVTGLLSSIHLNNEL